jgi:hypothetical protein
MYNSRPSDLNNDGCFYFARRQKKKKMRKFNRNTHDKINLDTQRDDYIKTAVIANSGH